MFSVCLQEMGFRTLSAGISQENKLYQKIQAVFIASRQVCACKGVEGWREDRGGQVAATGSCQPCYPSSGLPVAFAVYLFRTLCLANQGRPLHLHVGCHYHSLVGMVSLSTSSQIHVGKLHHQAEKNPACTWERGQGRSPRAQNPFERTENGSGPEYSHYSLQVMTAQLPSNKPWVS